MPTITELNSVTQELYLPEVTINFGSQFPLLKTLRAKGKKLQGGTKIRKTIAFQYTKGGSFGRGATFDLSGQTNLTAAEWTWRYYMWPTNIERQDERENSGPSQVHDLLDTKIKVVKFGSQDQLATDFFTGTGTDSTTDIHSIDHALDEGSTLSGNATYGGISKTTDTWWTGNVVDLGGGTVGPTFKNLNRVFTRAHDADVRPDLGMAHSTVVDTFIASQQSQQQYIHDSLAARMTAGFVRAAFNGIPLVADNHIRFHATTQSLNRVYFVNTDYMDFVTHVDDDMRSEGWEQPIDQPRLVWKLFWTGNFITWDPNRHAVGHNFDADSTSES